MRKIILSLAVSLDGFIEGPNGEYDWCMTDQDYGMTQLLHRVDSLFMGRKSYEMVAKLGMPPDFPPLKHYVFSTTLETVPSDITLVKDNVEAEVQNIKSANGKDIWLWGGASLTRSLIQLNAVDELWLAVHPILLGKGKRLFQEQENRIELKLLHAEEYSTGLVMHHYEMLP